MTKECVEKYLNRLAEGLAEYMEMPLSSRSTEAIDGMLECWTKVKALYDSMDDVEDADHAELNRAAAQEWTANMVNADGSVGGHWAISDTSNLSKPDDMPDWKWNAAMNMMYSDYCGVAAKYGVGSPRFFADMAKAFLHDADAVENKLDKYYQHIVIKHEM